MTDSGAAGAPGQGPAPLAFDEAEIESSIQERLSRVAQQLPTHLAYVDDGARLTYAELERASAELAGVLVDRLGSAWETVGLLLPHNAAALVGILGVIKAGKGYIPLDPAATPELKRSFLADGAPRALVTVAAFERMAGALMDAACEIICLDSLPPLLERAAALPASGPDTCMALWYTSGSTGKPKGVVRTHRQALFTAWEAAQRFQLGPADRVAWLTSYTLGSSNTRIFGTLLNGGTVVALAPQEASLGQLRSWLDRQQITVLMITPHLVSELMATLAEGEIFSHVRMLRVSGQNLSWQLASRIRRALSPEAFLINQLAATEVGVVTQYVIEPAADYGSDVVPIGSALWGQEILVLDEEHRPVESGCAGELAVRSRYLSPGYWQQPELTAAKYLPDPDGGDRPIYLTGDMGVMGQDGCIELRGRKDARVKIRGYGVEPGAVEAVLQTLPGVKEAVVAARPGRNGLAELVAFVVPQGQDRPAVSGLRLGLSASLPDYMVPARYAFLDGFKRTLSDKVDRQALPTVDFLRPELDVAYVAPRTPFENELARIWCEVLGSDRVGVEDNFLDLGGHSLAAARVVSRVQQALGIELPPHTVFERPTIAALAAHLVEHSAARLEAAELEELLAELADDAEAG